MKISEELLNSKPLNRLNDAYFKFVLASPERKHITVAFLNAVLGHYLHDCEKLVKVEDVEFLDREAVSEWQGAKVPRFDVFVRSSEGRLFHIEVQDAQDKHFLKRGLFYACHDFVMQSKRGLSYEDFEPVIFIGLVNFVLIGRAGGMRNWYTLHRTLDVASHDCNFEWLEFHMLELPRLRREFRKSGNMPSDELEAIMFYFGNIGGEKFMEAVAEKYPVVDELLTAEEKYRSDPLLWRQYKFAERAHLDYLLNLRDEREEGREEGREEVLRTLRSRGVMTDEQLADMFSMPITLIESL